MAFNPNKLPDKSGPTQELIPEDLYPARLARIIELGAQEDQYGIKRKVVFGFTLPDVTITLNQDGQEVEKQRMVWTFPINLPDSKNPDAKINKYINALNPDMEGWEDMLKCPCMLDIVEKDIKVRGENRTVNNIDGITKAPKAMQNIDDPDCEVYIFDFYNPDLEVWNKLSENRQEQIKKAHDYPGSDLQNLVEGSYSKDEGSDEEPPM